jgi:hypothetical protein
VGLKRIFGRKKAQKGRKERGIKLVILLLLKKQNRQPISPMTLISRKLNSEFHQ